MRTINPKIHMFKSLTQANKHFQKLPSPALLLQGLVYSSNFFVEEVTQGEPTAIECWPKHYKLIDKK